MYKVTITKSFSAAHALKIGGKCEDLHGHNFKVEVTAKGRSLSAEGILIDFRDLKKWTVEVLEEMDHKYLNELPPFAAGCATSEHVARHIYTHIRKKLKGRSVRVSEVTVWESDNSRVSYSGEER